MNDASLFWALVINNALVALGLPIIGGLWWYKRRQMLSWNREVSLHRSGSESGRLMESNEVIC